MKGIAKSAAHLRRMAESDLNMVLEWRNHPDVRRHMYSQKVISFAEHLRWFKLASTAVDRILLILEVEAVPLGYVNFTVDETEGATWGFYLAPDAPKGSGRLLGKASTDYAFGVLGLKRIWGEVLSDNLPSQTFHLHQGFVLESTLPEKTIDEQKIGNVHRYLLTRDAWLSHQGAVK